MHLDVTTTARLATVIRLTNLLALAFALALWLTSWYLGDTRVYGCAVVTTAFWVALLVARYQLARHHRTHAAYWLGGGALVAALLLTAVLPQLASSNAVVPLLVGIVMLQFAPYQHSRYYLGVCGLASVATVVIGITTPAPTLQMTFLSLLNVSLMITNVGVALFMLWQFSSRLQETLAHVQETNGVLVGLNNRVQRELHEHQRTEAALQSSERRTRALLNAIPDDLYRIQRDGQIIDAKPGEGTQSSLDQPLIEALLPSSGLIECAIKTRQIQRYERELYLGGLMHAYEGRLVVVADDELVVIMRDLTELKRVDRLKSEFVATVSHELRTPITAIRGSLGLLLGGVLGPLAPNVQSMLDVAARNCERLLRLVNDILDSEQIETGRLSLELRSLDLAALVEQTVTANRGYGAPTGVVIELLEPLPRVAVLADADRLTQALTNILSNAIKFSPKDSTVRVGVVAQGSSVRICVADTGPGIPEGFRNRIFQRFAQVDGSDQRSAQGSGLGLSIAKAIVERCKGSIRYTSEPGQGTTFFIELPAQTLP